MNPLIPSLKGGETDSQYFNELERLSSFERSEGEVNNRIKDLFDLHSDSLIADLVANPEHRKNYRKIGANLRQNDSLNSFQSSIGYVQKIARLLEKHDVQGLERLSHQMGKDSSSV